MRATDRIRNEHAEITRGLEVARSARDRAGFDALRRRLQAHVEAEERVFYAELAKREGLQNVVDLARREVAALVELLSEVEATRPGSEEYRIALEQVSRAFERHVAEDEHDGVMALAETALTEGEQERLGAALAGAAPSKVAGLAAARGPVPRADADVSTQQLTPEALEGGEWKPERGRRYGGGEFQGDQDALLPPQPPLAPGDRG